MTAKRYTLLWSESELTTRNESSQELSYLGAKVPTPRSENTGERKVLIPFLIGIIKTVAENVYVLLVEMPVVNILASIYCHCSPKNTCT